MSLCAQKRVGKKKAEMHHTLPKETEEEFVGGKEFVREKEFVTKEA